MALLVIILHRYPTVNVRRLRVRAARTKVSRVGFKKEVFTILEGDIETQ